MAWWNTRTGCPACQAKDQELARLRTCAGCKAREEHLKDLQAQIIAMRHAWNVERQEYKTAIDRLLAKEGQEPVGPIIASSVAKESPPQDVMNRQSLWDEREMAR